jgi:hypothetical protein
MYNKHLNKTIVYQVVVDNKIVISFNTKKKQDAFVEKLKAEGRRRIGSIGSVIYQGRNPFVTVLLKG